MRIDFATLFPEMCDRVMSESIIGRARRKGTAQVFFHNIRDHAGNNRASVDDYPYGGGPGMVMQAEPVAQCLEEIIAQAGTRPHIVFMSAAGRTLTQEKCRELARYPHLALVCGHYEGIDQRVADEYADEEISIGDYVITGGELAALVVADAVLRLCDGVLKDNAGYENESHWAGLLENPQYTRPEVWRGRAVPSVLLSGDHAAIARWQREESLARTKACRPDMYEAFLAAGGAAPAPQAWPPPLRRDAEQKQKKRTGADAQKPAQEGGEEATPAACREGAEEKP